MRILFISYCDPSYERTGDNIYTLNILSHLKMINAHIHFLSYNKNSFEKNNVGIIKSYCEQITFVPFTYKNKIRLVLSFYPASIKSRKNLMVVDKATEILQNDKYDFVVVNHFKMSFMIEHLNNKQDYKTVYVSHNVETSLSKSLYKFTKNPFKKVLYYQEYLKTKIYERKYLKEFDIITGISDFDVLYFKNLYNQKKIYLLPPLVENKYIPLNKDSENKKVILCGSFSWNPKRDNLMRLLNASNFKKLNERHIELLIVGNAPTSLVTRINRKYKGVKMTGYVPNTLSYYKESQIALVPELMGGGFKLKIAEAISFNRSIIALKESITDSEMKEGIHYFHANSFEEMIELTIELIQDDQKMNFLSRNAIGLCDKKYSKNAIQSCLLDIFMCVNERH